MIVDQRRIWIDLANSPQVLFFRPIIKELERMGHIIKITTRAYAQTIKLADKYHLHHIPIGKHGGGSFIELVRQNFLRSLSLMKWARNQRFDLALSHNSYSQVMAARMLGIPSITLMDYEHQPLNHLCFRLANRVIVPNVFPKKSLQQFGAIDKTLTYQGLKEEVYLADFEPSSYFREDEGFPMNTPLIVIRPPAPWTAYHRFENDLFDWLLLYLSEDCNAFLLFLPRLECQIESIRRIPCLNVANKVYDGPNLLYHADIVISGGGTMNREAAILGTPTYTIFKGKLGAVDNLLIQQGRMQLLSGISDVKNIPVYTRKGKKENKDWKKPELIQEIIDLVLLPV